MACGVKGSSASACGAADAANATVVAVAVSRRRMVRLMFIGGSPGRGAGRSGARAKHAGAAGERWSGADGDLGRRGDAGQEREPGLLAHARTEGVGPPMGESVPGAERPVPQAR